MKLLSLLTTVSSLGSLLPSDAAPISPRAAGKTVVSAGNKVTIDPNGVYIRGAVTNSGSLIAGYTAYEDDTATLHLVSSTNGGSSWTSVGEVYSAATATHDVDNAMPLMLPSGRIIFAYRNHDKTAAGVYTYYRLSVSYSDDGGKTWTFLSQISERAADAAQENGLWEPFLRMAADGTTVQAYYSSTNSVTDQDGYMRYSTNGGTTWSAPISVSGSAVTSRDGMIGVASTSTTGANSDDLIMIFENTESGDFTVDYLLSTDGGSTWHSRTRLYTPSSGQAGSPQIYNVGGTLVASFMTNEDVPSLPSLDGGQMKVVSSTDGGKTWSGSVVVGATGSHWGGLLTRDSTHFLALYSIAGSGAVSQLYSLQ